MSDMGGDQAEGFVGALVDRMIRRTVRQRFRRVSWIPPKQPLPRPCILVPNHHGWHDGYIMYIACTAMNLPVVDWIQEFDAFPLFAKVGGMPFPANDPARRAATIRKTIRLMQSGERNLILFAESELHRPPEILPFGRALSVVATRVSGAKVIPVAIRYEMSMNERPECFIMFGEPIDSVAELEQSTRLSVKALLDELMVRIRFDSDQFKELAKGTLDVNERMDMRSIPRIGKK